MYSSRQAKILSLCLLRDDYITYHEISEELQISSRTVMRELNQIKDSLHNLQILSKKGKGIRIIGRDEDKQNLIMDIQGSKIDYMDKEERQELLCLELLRTKDIQKLFYYSNKFQVSEATISHDLDDLETDFKNFHIQLIRRPGFGVGIEADENVIRQAISSIINKTIQHHILNVDFNRYNIQDVIDQMTANQNSNIKNLLDIQILKQILEVFQTHHQELDLDSIAKSSYMGLIIHLMIAVSRIKEGKAMSDNQEIFNLINDHQAYQKAELIVHYLSEEFDISFETTECAFIAIHLQSAKLTIIHDDTSVEEYHDVIMKMLSVFEEKGYHLLGDYELYQSLAAHLKPALVRLEYQLPIYNPMLLQIQENFADIFQITKLASDAFTDIYGYDMNDDEIGYLALHFAAAIERYQSSHLRPIQVGIVCSSGIGISALLTARLKRIVDANVQFIPLSLTDIEHHQCELLISTFEIDGALYVTPLLNQNDVTRVLQAIHEKRQQPFLPYHTQLSYDLIELTEMIKQFITHIQLHVISHFKNKQEVIEMACQHVTDNPQLVEEIQSREAKGSNVYPTFGFALLHCTTELVKECCVHILRADTGVFTGADIADIKVVLLMLMPRNALTLEKRMMSYISSQLIENQEFFSQLISGDEAKIIEAFNHILQNWIIKIIKEEE